MFPFEMVFFVSLFYRAPQVTCVHSRHGCFSDFMCSPILDAESERVGAKVRHQGYMWLDRVTTILGTYENFSKGDFQ